MVKPFNDDSDSNCSESADETNKIDNSKPKQSKHEKRARKMISKLNLKPVVGVNKVILRKTENTLIVIKKPDVYRQQPNGSYIIFGEVTFEDNNQDPCMAALKNCIQDAKKRNKGETVVPVEEDSDDDVKDIDETGIDEKDIQMVMSQANVSRMKAIKTLKRNENDLVNTIMELTI